MTWTRRTHRITHGRDGWRLEIVDERWAEVIAERAVEGVLAALGHPCCGRGLLSRLTVRYRTLKRLGLPVDPEITAYDELDENAMDLLWHRVLNLPNRLHISHLPVFTAALTEAEASALAPTAVESPRDLEESL